MFFELQMSSTTFCRIVRNRLKAVPICVDRQFTDENGTVLVVDQVIIGTSTWLQREQTLDLVGGLPKPRDIATQSVWTFSPTNLTNFTVPFLQVKQEVIINLVTATDLDANRADPSPVAKALTIYVVYNVALNTANQTQGGGPITLSYTFAHIDFGVLALVMSDQQRADITQFVAGVALPPTTVDMGPLTAVLQRPVAAINAGIACDPAGAFVALRVDFDVWASPIAVDRAFFEGGPINRLGGKDWAMIIDANLLVADARKKGKAALEGASKVRLNSGPDVSWNPGGPSVDMSAEVELVDACAFFGDDIDMDADVTISLGFSVPTTNTVVRHIYLHGEPSDIAEEIACALTGALLWPFIGPVLLKDEDIGAGLGAYMLGLAGGPLLAFIGIISAINTKTLSKDISKDLGGSCTKVDDENYECKDVMNLVMSLSAPLNSRLDVELATGVPEGLVLAGTVSNFRDLPAGSLDNVAVKGFAWQVTGRCTGNGHNNFRIANQATMTVLTTAPAGMCTAYLMPESVGSYALAVNDQTITLTPLFAPGSLFNPPRCRVRIITSKGVRVVTLGAPKLLGDSEAESLEHARLAKALVCYYWEKFFTPKERIQWYPDPPFVIGEHLQWWQVVVRGMRENEAVRVETPDGTTLVTARPSRSGLAHMTFVLPGEQAVDALTLELISDRREDDAGREVSVQQVMFERRSALPVGGTVRQLRFAGMGRSRRLMIGDGEQDAVWDVSASTMPMLLDATSVEVGDDAEHAVQTGKRVGVATTGVLREALHRAAGRFEHIEALGSPRVGGVGTTLYVRSREGARLYDVSSPNEEPRELQVFGDRGWLEGVALGGNLLARHDEQTGEVVIYAAIATATQ